MVELCFGVFVGGCEGFLGERRIDLRLAMVGIRDLTTSSGTFVAARLFVEADRARPCFGGDMLTTSAGMAGSGLFSCACGSFDGDIGTAVEGRETDRIDLILFDRGSADALFGVDVLSATLAADAFVGDNILLETGCGRADGLLEETSSSPSRRSRFAGVSVSSEEDLRIVLKGLTDVGRPITGGGMRVDGLLPAVLGRSGSPKSALEEDRFRDCSVGRAKPCRARNEEA